MRFLPLMTSTPTIRTLIFLPLTIYIKASYGLLSTTVLENLSRSLHPFPFPVAPIQNSAKGRTSLSSWSKIAEFDARSSKISLSDPDDVCAKKRSSTNHEGEESFSQTPEHDLASPRGWLEYCEATQESVLERDAQEQPSLDRTRAGGAYTVLRCDFLLEGKSWTIWGKDFHLNRLRESFCSLTRQIDFDSKGYKGIIENRLKFEREALDSSLAVMNLLLEEAKTIILSENDIDEICSIAKEGKSTITAMLTLLWDVDQNYLEASATSKSPIRVQGHVYSTLKAQQVHANSDISKGPVVGSNPNAPAQVVIGSFARFAHNRVLDYYKLDQDGPEPTFLPNRYQNFPEAKLSSWCRRRRPLESIFKLEGIGDVILTKHCDDVESFRKQEAATWPVAVRPTSTKTNSSVELLEGLTTNLFAVYPGRILRTAPSEYVLEGYVRRMIIDCAERCGYKVEFQSIPLADSNLWEEIFLTSSIRLIVPVDRIFLPTATDVNKEDELFKLESLWEAPSDMKRKNHDTLPPLTASDALYFELIALLTRNENDSLA